MRTIFLILLASWTCRVNATDETHLFGHPLDTLGAGHVFQISDTERFWSTDFNIEEFNQFVLQEAEWEAAQEQEEEVTLAPIFPIGQRLDLADSPVHLISSKSGLIGPRGSFNSFNIVLSSSGEVIGEIDTLFHGESEQVEIYRIEIKSENNRNKGYGPSALRTVLDVYRAQVSAEFNMFSLSVFKTNQHAIHVYKKLGFAIEESTNERDRYFKMTLKR